MVKMVFTQHDALRLDVVFLIITFFFVAIRCSVQYIKLRAFGMPDVLIIFAWFCFLANVLLDFHMQRFGFWDERITYNANGTYPDFDGVIEDKDSLVAGFKLQYGTQNMYYCLLYAIKASILLMYMRLFPPGMVNLRRALYTTFVLCGLAWLSTILLNLFYCLPIQSNWSRDPGARCLTWADANLYLYCGIMNVITDFIVAVYALPFFLIPTMLRTASREKIVGVIAMFSFGTLCIVCTLIRILIVGNSTETSKIVAWFAAEQACAITCACLPPLRWLCAQSIAKARQRYHSSKEARRSERWSGVSFVSRDARTLGKNSLREVKTESAPGSGNSTGGATFWTAATLVNPGKGDLEQQTPRASYIQPLTPKNSDRVGGSSEFDKAKESPVQVAMQRSLDTNRGRTTFWSRIFKKRVTSSSLPTSDGLANTRTHESHSTPVDNIKSTIDCLPGITSDQEIDSSVTQAPPSFFPAFMRKTKRMSAGFGLGYINNTEDNNGSVHTLENGSTVERSGSRGISDLEMAISELSEEPERSRNAIVRISAVVETCSRSLRSCRTGSSRGEDGCDDVRGEFSSSTHATSIATVSMESLPGSFTFGRR